MYVHEKTVHGLLLLQVFLLSIGSAAAGLTLTAANVVYMLDPCPSAADEAQALNRAHRYVCCLRVGTSYSDCDEGVPFRQRFVWCWGVLLVCFRVLLLVQYKSTLSLTHVRARDDVPCRIGQTKPVHCVLLYTRGTIEERMVALRIQQGDLKSLDSADALSVVTQVRQLHAVP